MTSIDPADRPLSLGQFTLGLLVLAICGCYGLVTLLYVSPQNPLRIYFDAKLNTFEKTFYQKWTFFAPPPTHNDRLYFAFSPKSGDGVTLEVLGGIYERKRQDNPFNVRIQVVDYAVSGHARQISDAIREVYRYRKVHDLFDGDPAYLDDLALRALDPESQIGDSLRVLRRYAAMVAAQQGIQVDGLKCQMALTAVPLRPFTQRYNSDLPIEEKLVYKTALMDIVQLAKR